MLRIGLTGGIGSGKSTVARIFELLNIPVFYADHAAKHILNTNAEVIQTVITLLGAEAYQNQKLNTSYVAQIVFKNPEKLLALNAIVHPPTLAEAEKWMTQQTAPYAILEAALLFESGADRMLDRIIVVTAPEALRIRRVTERDNCSAEDVKKRILRQMPEDVMTAKAHHIIRNDETAPLIPQVLSLHTLFSQPAINLAGK
ncbi:MAG: dephospho-CoA kinase [Chitinophagaceae bacterium]|nr:dephospho-CoA kinase [Chitinophagaceae bacterium]